MKNAHAEVMVLRAEVARLKRELADALTSKPNAPLLRIVPPPPKRVPRNMPAPLIEEARAEMAKPMTAARAAKLRALQRKLCGCARCKFGDLTPPKTFVAQAIREIEWARIAGTPDEHRDWADLLAGAR